MIGSDDIRLGDSTTRWGITIGGSVILATVLTLSSQPAIGVAFGGTAAIIAASAFGFDYLRAGCAFLGAFGLVSYALPSVGSIGTMALLATGAVGVVLSFIFASIAAVFATNTIAWFIYQALTFKGNIATMVKGFLVAPVAFFAAITNNELPIVGDIGEYVFAIFVVAIAFAFHGLNQGRDVFRFRRTARDTADNAAARARTGGLSSFLGGSFLGAASEGMGGEAFGSEQTFGADSETYGTPGSGSTEQTADAQRSATTPTTAETTATNSQPKGANSGTAADAAPADSSATEPTARCLACEATIPTDAAFCPACGTESPFEPGDDGVEGNDSPAVDETTSEAASAIARRFRPTSSPAQELCDTLSDTSASDAEIETALTEVVERLEEISDVTDIADAANQAASPEEYERVAGRIKRNRGALSAALASVTARLEEQTRKRQQRTEANGTLRAEAETICAVAEQSDAVPSRNGSVEQRAGTLAAALRDGSVTIAQPATPIETGATNVEHTIGHAGRPAERLLAALKMGDDRSEVQSAIESSVEALEEHAQTEKMLSEIRVRDVETRLESLTRELRSRDTPIYTHLGDRIMELESMIEDGSVDDIQLYAIYQEVSFYDRTLLPRLERSKAASTPEGARSPADIRRRIDAIDSEYVSVRPDHNHSIPKHFVELAENLAAQAEEMYDAAPERADGLITVADGILDYVEALYERNEYSVMLRRLQG